MKYMWPSLRQGVLYSRDHVPPMPLTQDQIDYMVNRLFDRCNVDVLVRRDGRIVLVARKIKLSRP
jgi:hypothetical protein